MTEPLLRHVSGRVELNVRGPADLIFSIAVAQEYAPTNESMSITVGDSPMEFDEVIAPGGTRLTRVLGVPSGRLVLEYAADVPESETDHTVSDLDAITFTRPSRYCDSDRLNAVAATHFGQFGEQELVNEVVGWVRRNITYAPGSSDVVDGALEAYLSRRGVCRDSAQLVITFLRARNLPARLVSVYAPGLNPMDFHAVAEVAINGQWYVVDGTGMAPRRSLVRIATGRDAADTAFLTVLRGFANLVQVSAGATVDPALPRDNDADLVQLA